MKEDPSVKKIYDLLAFGISALFSPYITATIFILTIVYLNADSVKQFLPWIGIALLFAVIIPGGYILWLLERNHVQDFHLSNRNERKIPFMVAGISSVVGAIALAVVGAAKPVVVMGVAYAVNSLVVAFLTLFWKVSIHTALFSAVITVIVILFGIQFTWLYLLLVPLCWSRIHRHRHSLNQVIGGAGIAFVLTSIVFWLFGYI